MRNMIFLLVLGFIGLGGCKPDYSKFDKPQCESPKEMSEEELAAMSKDYVRYRVCDERLAHLLEMKYPTKKVEVHEQRFKLRRKWNHRQAMEAMENTCNPGQVRVIQMRAAMAACEEALRLNSASTPTGL